MAEDQNRTMQDKFMLRMPDGMRDRLRLTAEVNNRSMNSEIVARVERSYNEPPVPTSFDVIAQKFIDKLGDLKSHITQKDVEAFLTGYKELKNKETELTYALVALAVSTILKPSSVEEDRMDGIIRDLKERGIIVDMPVNTASDSEAKND